MDCSAKIVPIKATIHIGTCYYDCQFVSFFLTFTHLYKAVDGGIMMIALTTVKMATIDRGVLNDDDDMMMMMTALTSNVK